jgi:hypothetical protein
MAEPASDEHHPSAVDDTELPADDAGLPGEGIVTASLVSTGAFTAAAVVATAFPDQVGVPVAVFDCLLFAVGVVVFGAALLKGLDRSRTEEVQIGSLFFLVGDTAPREVKVRLLGAFAVQVVVALVTASIRVYTEVAFGILVPILGLALAGRWGARHGRFPARATR